MALSLEPQTKDYGDVNSPPNITVSIKESDNLEIRGTAKIIDGENHTVKTEEFTSKGKHTYSPNLVDKWEDMPEGDSKVELTVKSYEEIKESPVYADKNNLYLEQTSFTYDGYTKTPVLHGYDSTKMRIYGDTSAINAGTYVLKVKPLDGYYWSMPPNGADKYSELEFSWNITQGKGSIVINGTTVYNGGTYTVNISRFNTANTYSIYSNQGNVLVDRQNDTNIATTKINGTTLSITAYKNGNTSCWIYVPETSNTSTTRVFIIINVSVVEKLQYPHQAFPLIENGYGQSPTWTDYDPSKMVLTPIDNLTQWSPGTYEVYFTPISPNVWVDGSSSSYRGFWGIEEKVEDPITVDPIVVVIGGDDTPSNDFYFTLSTNSITVPLNSRRSLQVYCYNEPRGVYGQQIGQTINVESNSSIAVAQRYTWEYNYNSIPTNGDNQPFDIYIDGRGRGTTVMTFSHSTAPSQTLYVTVT